MRLQQTAHWCVANMLHAPFHWWHVSRFLLKKLHLISCFVHVCVSGRLCLLHCSLDRSRNLRISLRMRMGFWSKYCNVELLLLLPLKVSSLILLVCLFIRMFQLCLLQLFLCCYCYCYLMLLYCFRESLNIARNSTHSYSACVYV